MSRQRNVLQRKGLLTEEARGKHATKTTHCPMLTDQINTKDERKKKERGGAIMTLNDAKSFKCLIQKEVGDKGV